MGLNTGVVLKALYVTLPEKRSRRGSLLFSTPTTCTCAIWSCGTENSSALSDLASDEEYEVIFDSAAPGPALQPANGSTAASPVAKKIGIVNFFMANSSFPPPGASVPSRSCTSPVLGDKQADSPGKCVPHPNNRAGSRPRVGRRTD